MEKKSFGLRKWKVLLSVFHVIFLVITLAGISAMYLNGGYGKGIRWIYDETYEDSNAFCSQLGIDISNIFTYIGYKDMFETNGVLDMHKNIVRITDGPGVDENMTLDQIVRYAKIRGYYLGEDFTVQGSPMAMDDDDMEITVEYKTDNPGLADADGLETRMTKEEMALDILDRLGKYYTIYYNFISNNTNVRFRIFYKSDSGEEAVYTNVPSMSLDELRGFGKYLFIPGNTIRMESNLALIPENAASLLETWNPFDNDQNYMVVSVDTNYPYVDKYAKEAGEYKGARSAFIVGMGAVIAGMVGFFTTLVALVLLSGHEDELGGEIRLFPIDKMYTESCVLLCAAATAGILYLCRKLGILVIGLFASEEHLAYWNKLLKYVILYGCSILCGFSLLRRYKANTLWEKSIAKKAVNASKDYIAKASFVAGTSLCYLLFLVVNGMMMWGTLFLFAYKDEKLTSRILFYVCAVLFVGLDGWIYHRLFRKAEQKDLLNNAITCIAKGDTGFRLDTKKLTGKERTVGDHINNIGSGLDTALQEKVKSERLKADLITNVSHDIKTPLTSIINYVDLLKRQKIQDPKIASYLEVLDQKSQRLKTLTEDLVEASKASSGNLKLEVTDIDLVELVQQTNGEFEERFDQRHLKIISDFPDGMIIIKADGRRLWRVLENLYTNAFKYAQEGSRVYVDVASVDGKAIFTMKNISEKPLNISPDELTERFVRGDVARTTEGSGLGLSIARSLTQLQKGEFVITIDGDLFKAQVIFPQVRQETRAEMRLERAAEEKRAEEQSGEKMSGEMPVGENLLEIVPYNWDVMVENDKNLTVKEEVLIRNGNRENKQET